MIPVTMFQVCWVQTKWMVFTSNSSSFGSLHPCCCQFVCGLCFGWLDFLTTYKTTQTKQIHMFSLSPSLSKAVYSILKELPSIQWSFCSLLWVFCFIFKCVSSLPTDVFCQFYFSNGFVGKSKWSLTLISVFTVPTRARDVLHNHQQAVKDLIKAMPAQNSKRSLQNLGLSLCRGVRLYLHTLSQRKRVSRNEKKVCKY